MRAELTIAQSTDLHDGGGATYNVPWTSFYRSPYNDRIATQIICEPSGGRSRKMVAIVAGCRSFRTFRDCHTSIHDRRSATKFDTHIRTDVGLIRT